MKWLKVDFENFPTELTALNRWVTWKDNKVPFNPMAINSKASVIEPNTWGSFEQAKTAYNQGGWNGVGFVLNGDGIAGIDIDKCIIDCCPDQRAIRLLEGLDAAYIELSPSGTGLRAFGLAKPLKNGKRGVIDDLNVELYSTYRYLTLTGKTIKKEPLRSFVGFEKIAFATKHSTEETEDTECNSSASYVSSVEVKLNWPRQVIPAQIGQRNKKIFELARWLKGAEPNASIKRQRIIFTAWLDDHKTTIGTNDIGVNWADWRNAWDKVQYPFGETLLNRINELPSLDHITVLQNYGGKGMHLLQICVALQNHEGNNPFFLAARKAGELIGVHHTQAASLLRAFVMEGWLKLISKGSNHKASRYRYMY